MYFNLSSILHFAPDVIDKMKVYMAVIYTRRLKKGGFLGSGKESDTKKGTAQDFMKIFG